MLVGHLKVIKDRIKDRIKGHKLSDCTSEDIEAIATDCLKDCEELHGAGMCDHALTMKMLNTIMTAGGDAPKAEDLRFPLRAIKKKLNKKLLMIHHMDYHMATTTMSDVDLDVQSVLEATKDECRTIHDEGKWPTAMHAKDSKAMSKNYGSVNMAASEDIQQCVHSLMQNAAGGRDKSGDTCNNCGLTGHWARDCPERPVRWKTETVKPMFPKRETQLLEQVSSYPLDSGPSRSWQWSWWR